MTLHRLVECNLAQSRSCVCVCRQQRVNIGVDKDPNWEISDSKQDLRGCLVLSVKDADNRPRVVFRCYPPKRNMKLWTLVMELLHEFGDILPDGSGVYLFVM